ncbi:hypothetical protein GCM10027287_08440 [Bordetella muralis]
MVNSRVIGLEREPISAQAIVIEVLQGKRSGCRIINDHAAALQLYDLLSVSSGRFAKGAFHRLPVNAFGIESPGGPKK